MRMDMMDLAFMQAKKHISSLLLGPISLQSVLCQALASKLPSMVCHPLPKGSSEMQKVCQQFCSRLNLNLLVVLVLSDVKVRGHVSAGWEEMIACNARHATAPFSGSLSRPSPSEGWSETVDLIQEHSAALSAMEEGNSTF